MPGCLTEVLCSMWLLLAVIMTNTNQDQAVHKMVVWHHRGFGNVLVLGSFAREVTPPPILPLPHFYTSLNYRNAPISVRVCWVWAPDFHSLISVCDDTLGVKDGGIWFKSAGGYSAAAVERIIAGVILPLAPIFFPSSHQAEWHL